MTDILATSTTTTKTTTAPDLDEREVARAALAAAEEQLESLTASHAGTFVSVERRGKALQDSLRDMLESIKGVEDQVEVVKQALDQEEENEGSGSSGSSSSRETSLAVLSERHRVRRRTLLQHSSLLELLELPSLMDACVRSNLYDEALSIAAFSNTLERRHKVVIDTSTSTMSNNQVVSTVIAQIRSRQADLRRILLHRLKSSITMPECLEVVTALRRLNSIDLERQSSSEKINLERVHAAMEVRLEVDFLEARDAWLDAKTTSSATTVTPVTSSSALLLLSSSSSRANTISYLPASEELLDTIERYRTRVFEIATQFNAIFRAQAKSSSGSASSVSLLSMWMARRIRAFLTLLTSELDLVQDSASLRDALEASIFFANSMGRLGADFTAQLPAIFEARMLALIQEVWKHGVEQLQETLSVCRQAGVASPLVSQTADADDTTSVEIASSSSLAAPLPPPRMLLTLPPLARFVNAILSGFNELRRCLLPGIFVPLRAALEQDVLNAVETELINHERAVLKPGFRGEAAQLREIAARFKSVFGDVVNPYLRGSLEAAIGNAPGAECLYQIYLDSVKKSTVPEEDKISTEHGKEEDKASEDADILPSTSEVKQGLESEDGKAEASQSETTDRSVTNKHD